MRRDYFELAVENVDWVDAEGDPVTPVVRIDSTGPREALEERLTDVEGDLLDGEEVDVAFRLQDSLDGSDPAGVVGVTNRVTGEFVLELNEDAEDVLRFIRAAREYGKAAEDDEPRYRVEISLDGEPLVTYEKATFLVYDAEGNLVRRESLIPSGVEL